MKYNFIDAQQMAVMHPDTFEAPTLDDLAALKVGDYAKVGAKARSGITERFWCYVVEIDGEKVTGTVNNDLVLTSHHGLAEEDKLIFEKRHIYSITN